MEAIVPRWRLYLRSGLAGLLVVCSGCVAVESIDGPDFVYRQSPLVPIILGVFGLGLAVTGVVAAIQSIPLMMPSKPVKKKGKKKPTQSRGFIQFGFACLGAFLGLSLVLLGIPSTLLSTVTIKPDRMVLRTGNMFYSTTTREIAFDSISDSQVEVQKAISSRGFRKNKSYWMIAHEDGLERIEMNPMHIAAQPKFDQLLKAFRTRQEDDGGNLQQPASPGPGTPVTNLAATQSPTTAAVTAQQPLPETKSTTPTTAGESVNPADPGATVVSQRGRFRAGKAVGFIQQGKYVNGKVDQVFANDKVAIRPDTDPSQVIVVPISSASISTADGVSAPVLPGEEIRSTSDVKVGDTLLAVWGAYWYPVRVDGFGMERYVSLTFIGEPNIARFQAPISQTCRLPKNGDLLVRAAMGEPVDVEFPRADGRAIDFKVLANQFKVDQTVMAKFGGDFHPANILVIRSDGMVRVHYLELENSFDADIAPDQIREMTAKEKQKLKSKSKKK